MRQQEAKHRLGFQFEWECDNGIKAKRSVPCSQTMETVYGVGSPCPILDDSLRCLAAAGLAL